jgi:hypothetical protein
MKVFISPTSALVIPLFVLIQRLSKKTIVIITRLRKKIETDPKNPKYLQTLRGAGYVLWIE